MGGLLSSHFKEQCLLEEVMKKEWAEEEDELRWGSNRGGDEVFLQNFPQWGEGTWLYQPS